MSETIFELELFIYGMAEDENGDHTLADALTPPVEPQFYDVELRMNLYPGTPAEDVLTLAEHENLTEDAAEEIATKLATLIPETEITRL